MKQLFRYMLNKNLIISAALSLVFVSAGAQPPAGFRTRPEKVTKADYAQAARFSAKKVGQMVYSTAVTPRWFKDSDKFWYEWKTSAGTVYYMVDPATGKKEEVFDLEKLAMQLTEIVRDPFDAQHIPFSNLKLKEDKYFTFDIRSTAEEPDPDADASKKGKEPKMRKKVFHFRYDIGSKELTQIPEQPRRYPDWAVVSPDGKLGIYMKNNDLWYMDSTSLRKAAKDPKDSTLVEHRLTKDGTHDFSWGVENYHGNTTVDSTKRVHPSSLRWAPDSRHFATIRWDMSAIKDFWVINSLSNPRPTLETYKYQMPGEKGAKGYLYVFEMPSGQYRHIKTAAFKEQEMDIFPARPTAEDAYKDFRNGKWLGDGESFYLGRISRDLKRYDLCRVDISADSTKTIISERSNTYVEYRNPVLLKGGSQIVHWSERNGWANLYLYDSEGKLVRNLTEGAWHVEDVIGVDEAGGGLIASICGFNKGENPYQAHTFRVGLSGGAPKQLDMPDMDVDARSSYSGKWFVANYSRVDCKPAVALYSGAGRKVMDLEESDFSQLLAAGYKFPERFSVKAADGITDLYGAIYKPFDFDSTKVYPVCDYVYPGPQVEANNISWSRNFTRVDRLAQLGFIVITVGNRGGHPNRSKWYHNFGYGNLRDYGLEDQKYALQQLCARYPWMDESRVGIHGHSGGGFMSTAAILTYPDFFKVAVSCSGNHDNSIYNRWWSEQHHGIQEKIVEGDTTFVYHIEKNQDLAANLKGHLLLVTGDIDNNVHPSNTIRVVNALMRANKRFSFSLIPGQRHGYADLNEYFFWEMADFYTQWLMGDRTPRPVDIAEMNND